MGVIAERTGEDARAPMPVRPIDSAAGIPTLRGMLSMIWKGLLLGLGAAAPIGPVNVEIARRCLRSGFRTGFLVGCGAVTIDVTYAVLTTLSIRPFLDQPVVMRILGIAGGLLLTWLGGSCIAGAVKQMKPTNGDFAGVGGTKPVNRNYVTGLLMTSLNPMTLVFWFVAVPGVAGQLSADPARDLPFVCVGVFVGALSWVIFFATLMSAARKLNRRKTIFIADISGGLMLLGFAAMAFWHVARPLW